MTDPLPPRLLDLKASAAYMGGISPWTIRRLIETGALRPVRLPSVRHRGESGRRLLFAKEDLDRAIDAWKER